MNRATVLEGIKRERLTAILRRVPDEKIPFVAEALLKGGVYSLECTYDHEDPDALVHHAAILKKLITEFGNEMLIGSGTVLTEEEAENTAAAGGQFIISPNTDEHVIRRTRELELVSIPGALTPTEVVTAWNAGADIVKLFPAGELGTGYLKALRGPLGHIPMMAVGGVKPENVSAFMDAGMIGFGVGGELIKKDLVAANDWEGLTSRAKAFTDEIRRWEAVRA